MERDISINFWIFNWKDESKSDTSHVLLKPTLTSIITEWTHFIPGYLQGRYITLGGENSISSKNYSKGAQKSFRCGKQWWCFWNWDSLNEQGKLSQGFSCRVVLRLCGWNIMITLHLLTFAKRMQSYFKLFSQGERTP